MGAKPSLAKCQWDFPVGTTVAFRHLKLEEHKFDWQGLQICLLMFEELTHFSKSQFIFLMGSNRSTCGVRPYIRATCNPDADSWVKDLVKPFLADDGYVDLEQVGKIKYLIIEDEQFKFVDADYRDELGNPPISFTYISADVWDNQELLAKDPGYLRNLMAQSAVDRDRFLGIKGRGGNWNAKATAGKVFRSDWFEVVDQAPKQGKMVRFWDLALSGDWLVGVKMVLCNGLYYIVDVVRTHGTPAQLESTMKMTAQADGYGCPQQWFKDPGQAGVYQEHKLRQLLVGYDCRGVLSQVPKTQRAKPFSTAAEFGEVKLLRSDWNTIFTNELVGFPDGIHDDQVDAGSGAYLELAGVNAYGAAVSGQFAT